MEEILLLMCRYGTIILGSGLIIMMKPYCPKRQMRSTDSTLLTQRQPSTNVAKAHTAAKQYTSNPSPDSDAFLRDEAADSLFMTCDVGRRRFRRLYGW